MKNSFFFFAEFLGDMDLFDYKGLKKKLWFLISTTVALWTISEVRINKQTSIEYSVTIRSESNIFTKVFGTFVARNRFKEIARTRYTIGQVDHRVSVRECTWFVSKHWGGWCVIYIATEIKLTQNEKKKEKKNDFLRAKLMTHCVIVDRMCMANKINLLNALSIVCVCFYNCWSEA